MALARVLLELLTLEVVATDDAASVLVVPVCCICNSSDCSSEASCWKADEKSLLLALVLLLVALELDVLEVEERKDVVLADDELEVEDADLYQST